MSDTDQNMAIGKPGRRNRKAEARRQKSEQPRGAETDQRLSGDPDRPQSPEPEQVERAPIDTMAAPPEAAAIEPAATAEAIPANAAPISLRTIANAYGDYTLKSMEETRCFVERLSGARSLDKAMEVQRDFAKQAYATFVAETQKISELHRELAKQTLKPLERLVAKAGKAGH